MIKALLLIPNVTGDYNVGKIKGAIPLEGQQVPQLTEKPGGRELDLEDLVNQFYLSADAIGPKLKESLEKFDKTNIVAAIKLIQISTNTDEKGAEKVDPLHEFVYLNHSLKIKRNPDFSFTITIEQNLNTSDTKKLSGFFYASFKENGQKGDCFYTKLHPLEKIDAITDAWNIKEPAGFA